MSYKNKTRFIGAVEIGTSKITVLVGELVPGRSLNIIGVGECPAHGVIKGSVADFKAASGCVNAALMEAEKRARVKIDTVYLAQTGAHYEGFYNEESVAVSASDNLVSQLDVDRVCLLAKGKELPEGRYVLHQIRRPFRLDGRLVPDPENLFGRRLHAGYWIVHGQQNKMTDNIHVITSFNVEVGEMILASLASGTMVTTLEDRRNGVLVIDLGCGTTDFVLYRDGQAHLTGVLPVAGDHLTNDLALGLRLKAADAEKLKLRFGSALVRTRDRHEKVWLNGDYAIGDRQFYRQSIEQITAVRTQEIFEVVRKKLGPDWTPEKAPAGVVLTGGTAKLPGIDEAAARVFGVTARVGEAPGWVHEDLRDPGFSTPLGLLYYGLNAQPEAAASGRRKAGLFSKLFAFA